MKIARADLARFLHTTKLWHAKILTQSEFANILNHYISTLEYDYILLGLYMKTALLKSNVIK